VPEPLRAAVAQASGQRQAHVDSTPPQPAACAPGLWQFDLTLPIADPDLATLDDNERTHAARLRFEADRRAYLNAHLALRGVLAGLVGVEPGALRFGRGPHGKPSLPGSGLAFNLSHSGPVGLLVAGSSALEWGIDIERIRPLPDALAVARRVFTPAEQEAIWREPPDHQLRAFMTLWTRKEACLKAIGSGFSVEPDRFEAGWAAGSNPAWQVVELPTPDGPPTRVLLANLNAGADVVAAWAAWPRPGPADEKAPIGLIE
jgi:4'-phosphopantetheinyl transferase